MPDVLGMAAKADRLPGECCIHIIGGLWDYSRTLRPETDEYKNVLDIKWWP